MVTGVVGVFVVVAGLFTVFSIAWSGTARVNGFFLQLQFSIVVLTCTLAAIVMRGHFVNRIRLHHRLLW